jgi:hypothetical protein
MQTKLNIIEQEQIVNLETNKTGSTEKINTLNLDGNSINDRQEMANAFSKCYS